MPKINCLFLQVIMDALPVLWRGQLVMLDHLYGFVSVIEDMKRYRQAQCWFSSHNRSLDIESISALVVFPQDDP